MDKTAMDEVSRLRNLLSVKKEENAKLTAELEKAQEEKAKYENKICKGCGGELGVECFNEKICIILNQKEQASLEKEKSNALKEIETRQKKSAEREQKVQELAKAFIDLKERYCSEIGTDYCANCEMRKNKTCAYLIAKELLDEK